MKTSDIKTFKDLESLNILELKKLWQDYFYKEYNNTKQSALKPLWYKIQCKNKNLKIDQKHITKLNRYAKDPDNAIEKSYKTNYKIKSGLEITKIYKGRSFKVKVLSPKEYMFNDNIYKTISAVATAICKKKVSGYDFFGFNNKKLRRQNEKN